MATLKNLNSSDRSQCMDDLFAIEIDNLAASKIGGGAATAVAATAMVFDDSTVWTITSSKSNPEGVELSISTGTDPAVAGFSYRFRIGDNSIEHSLSNFFKQKFDGRQRISDYRRSLFDYLLNR